MRVSDILKVKGADVHTVPRGAKLRDAVRVLAERNIGAVVIAEGKAVVGILSERDIVRAAARSGPDALLQSVETVMTSGVVSCTPDDDIEDLMEVMTTKRFRHLPVLREGALEGIISIGDVVKNHVQEKEQEVAALKEYISA